MAHLFFKLIFIDFPQTVNNHMSDRRSTFHILADPSLDADTKCSALSFVIVTHVHSSVWPPSCESSLGEWYWLALKLPMVVD